MIALLLLLHGKFNATAQQPAYFTLGENHFKGIQIYDIIQDANLNYIIATNDGLFVYDFNNFERLPSENAKNISFFNFVSDVDGTIYCNNLNNQIFVIKNKKCTLFYELKSDEGTPVISMAIDDQQRLVIGARKIVVLNKNGTVNKRYPYIGLFLTAFQSTSGAVIFHKTTKDSILVFKQGEFQAHQVKFASNKKTQIGILKFFHINTKNYAFDIQTKQLFQFNLETFTLTQIENNNLFTKGAFIRIYETGDEVWLAGTLPGVGYLNNESMASTEKYYYDNYFISDVFKDKEGNILMGTFDNGILVIPNMNIPDVIGTFEQDPINTIFADKEAGLILGTTNGKILKFQNGISTTVSNNGKRNIEALFGDANNDFVFYDDEFIRAYNKKTGTVSKVYFTSLKDVEYLSPTQFALGTNVGIIKVEYANNEFKAKQLNEIKFRVYSLSYNPNSQNLFASTISGLYLISKDNKTTKITHQKSDIFPTKLVYDNNKIYALTRDLGILTIEGEKVVGQILPKINGVVEILKNLVIYKNTIIAYSNSGLFQFNMKGELTRQLNTAFGFGSKKVIGFSLMDDELWVIHAGGVQKINLDYNLNLNTKPVIRIDAILVNDRMIDFLKLSHFKNNQRKIQFILSMPTLRNRENSRFWYKLIGYDTAWHLQNYNNNQITYNALASGSYTLQVKAEVQGHFSEVQEYKFTIASPFYGKWWFILLTAILFFATVFFIYKWQLNLQRKKSNQLNELNSSKLTAIKSQMNPHFIFNSLNSIQDLILKGEVEYSYSYITTFSNLVRRTLNYSEKDFIEFEEEIKLLELYLSLEKLRFKKDFEYEIDINFEEDLLIPPMIIQPFIENALVHGLLHKDGMKKLTISFDLTDSLQCTIEDNGIGRERAKAIKLRKKSEHESFSGKAITTRFEILSRVFKGQFGYQYTDLKENELSTGTRVELKIPIKRQF